MKNLVVILIAFALAAVVVLRQCTVTPSLPTDVQSAQPGDPDRRVSAALDTARADSAADVDRHNEETPTRTPLEHRPSLTVVCQGTDGTPAEGVTIALAPIGQVAQSGPDGEAVFADLERGRYRPSLATFDFVARTGLGPIDLVGDQRLTVPVDRALAAVVRYDGLSVHHDALALELGQATNGANRVAAGVGGASSWDSSDPDEKRIRGFLEARFPAAHIHLITTAFAEAAKPAAIQAFTDEAGLISEPVELLPPESIVRPTIIRLSDRHPTYGRLRVDVSAADGPQVPLTGIEVIAGENDPAEWLLRRRELVTDGFKPALMQPRAVVGGETIELPIGRYTVTLPSLPGRHRGQRKHRVDIRDGETAVVTVELDETLYPFRLEAWHAGRRVHQRVLADVTCNSNPLFRIVQDNIHQQVRWLPAGDLEVSADVHDLGWGTTSFGRTAPGFTEQMVVIQLHR